MSNVANEFIIELNGKLIRVNKGITIQELVLAIGDPYKIEGCLNPINQRYIYKSGTVNRYAVLFTKEKLVYIAKSK